MSTVPHTPISFQKPHLWTDETLEDILDLNPNENSTLSSAQRLGWVRGLSFLLSFIWPSLLLVLLFLLHISGSIYFSPHPPGQISTVPLLDAWSTFPLRTCHSHWVIPSSWQPERSFQNAPLITTCPIQTHTSTASCYTCKQRLLPS